MLTPKEAAVHLGLPVSLVYRLARENRIACVRTKGVMQTRMLADATQPWRNTGRLYFREADLDAWLEAHRSTGAPTAPSASLQRLMPKTLKFRERSA